MGQKVNPNGFRLGIIKPWHARWYADKGYAERLYEDHQIRTFLRKRLANAAISHVTIDRARGKSAGAMRWQTRIA